MNKDICYLRPKINKNKELKKESEHYKTTTKRNHSVNYNKSKNYNKQINASLETLSIYDNKDNSSLSSLSNNYLLSSFNADNKHLNNRSYLKMEYYYYNANNVNPFSSQRSSTSKINISEMQSYIKKLESMVNYYTDLIDSIKTTLVSIIFNILLEYCS